MKSIIVLFALFLTGCSDAEMSKITAIGHPGHIACYSGDKAFYEGESTGKIMTEHGTDGWYFEEKGTGDLIRVSGNCVIRN